MSDILLAWSRGQPLNGDIRKCLKIRVAGEDCSCKSLSKRGNKAIQITSAGRRLQPGCMESQMAININDLDGRCIDGRKAFNSCIKPAFAFQPVNDFSEIYSRHIKRPTVSVLRFLDNGLYPCSSGLILEER